MPRVTGFYKKNGKTRPITSKGSGGKKVKSTSKGNNSLRWTDEDQRRADAISPEKNIIYRWRNADEILQLHQGQAVGELEEGKHFTTLAYSDLADTFVPTIVKWNHGAVDDFTNRERSQRNQVKALKKHPPRKSKLVR